MGWVRWVGRSMFLGSLAVAGGAAVNQLLTGGRRLSWTAAYFALVFTVLGVLLDQLPARKGEGRQGRHGAGICGGYGPRWSRWRRSAW
jgi:hypothetical protein